MKSKIFLRIFSCSVVGFILPYAIAMLNLFSFLNWETSYELVLRYMFYSAITGTFIGIVWAFRPFFRKQIRQDP